MEIELEVFVLSIFIHHSMDMIKVKGGTWKAEILQFFGIMGIEWSKYVYEMNMTIKYF